MIEEPVSVIDVTNKLNIIWLIRDWQTTSSATF